MWYDISASRGSSESLAYGTLQKPQALLDQTVIIALQLLYYENFAENFAGRGYGVMSGNFGFFHEKTEIKILILFIMRLLSEPVTLDVLAGLTIYDDGISYFDFIECVAELVKTEHMLLTDNKYTITAKGVRNGEITENSLPFTVRRSVENATNAVRTTHTRNTMITAYHESDPSGGCKVSLALSDGIGDILNIELFAANEKQAKSLEEGFRKKAENVYHSLIELILEK